MLLVDDEACFLCGSFSRWGLLGWKLGGEIGAFSSKGSKDVGRYVKKKALVNGDKK